jgi:hypothetical protein
MSLSNNWMMGVDKLGRTSRSNWNDLIQQVEQALRDTSVNVTDLIMLFSNNVNLRPGEQFAIDAIQQQLLLAILGVATSASGLAPSLSMAQSQQQQQEK